MRSVLFCCLFLTLLAPFCIDTCWGQPTEPCPTFSFCPEACNIANDSRGCLNCFCIGDSNEVEATTNSSLCPDQEPCPEKCRSRRTGTDNCTRCVCSEGERETPPCIEPVGDCPSNCSLAVDASGCKTCSCSSSQKSNSVIVPAPPLLDFEHAECNSNKSCNGSNTRCVDGTCVCEQGYERNATDRTCYRLPRLGEKCFINGTVFRCYGIGVQPYCDTYGDKDSTDKNKCVCEPLHEPNVEKTHCKLRARYLGDRCTADTDCLTAYSTCKDGKCDCQDGFVPSGVTCFPKEHKCPDGKVLNDDGTVRKCEYRFGSYDTCPSDTFCFVEPRTLTINGSSTGHCCVSKTGVVDPAYVCPVGVPLFNATCPDEKLSPLQVAASSDKVRLCASATHECTTHPPFKGRLGTCCPLPCRQGSRFFAYAGRCYQYAAIGEQCEIQAQCIGGSRCTDTEEGERQCRCPPRFTQVFRSYCKPPIYEDVPPLTARGQAAHLQRRKSDSTSAKRGIGLLGQPCERTADCITAYAVCGASKVCSCSSGFIQRGNTICEPREYRCPLGQPLKQSGQNDILPCFYYTQEGTTDLGNHTCPPSYFCYRYADTKTVNGNSAGHCCKEPTSEELIAFDVVCPIGDPLPSGVCPELSLRLSRDLEAKLDKSRACPHSTHVCYFHFMSPDDQPCCPKPCLHSPNHFAADGTCYEQAYAGQPCSIDAQCAAGRCRQSLGGGRICD